MKHYLTLFLFAAITLTACKKDTQQESKVVPATAVAGERVVQLEGEFYYDDEAAVLKGKNYIYGVQRDLMADELAKRTLPKKRNAFDMIPVTIKAVIQPNPAVAEGGEGWDEIVIIKEIIGISDPTDEETIKIESGS